MQMNIQEFATAVLEELPLILCVFNNEYLGMVRQWQKLFYHERYSSTILDPVPDFVKLADAYGWEGERIEKPEDVAPAIARMLASEKPYLLDVAISPDQNVYPMVAPGAALDNVIGAIDVTLGAVRVNGKGVGKKDEKEGEE